MKGKVVVKDHGFDKLMQRVKDMAAMKDASVKVGVLADSEEGGLHEAGAALTVAEIFAVLNFGTRDGRIRPRPVLTQTFDAQREHLKDMGTTLMADVIFGNVTLDTALNMMGATLAAAVKAAITAGFPPPNAPSTAMRKASKGKTKAIFNRQARTLGHALAQVGALAAVKPFIDTGRLLGAITWAVVRGKEKE